MLILGCSQKTANLTKNNDYATKSIDENIYIGNEVQTDIDSIIVYQQHAQMMLNLQDTIGARIYFEKAFDLISTFDEETKFVLMESASYDSIIQLLNSEYEKVYRQEIYDQEAEEVREELTNIEEEAFGDSTQTALMDVLSDSGFSAIPLAINQRVELALKYFQTKGRKVFTAWLERTGKYENMVKEILQEYNLPEELFYLAMIESGLNPRAFSYARASGMWQFIYSTGNYYGLRSDWWFDERRDPILATHAAAKHLKDLYDRFDDWYLALAGYNCNPKKIERRITQYKTRDFYKLKRLPRQTRNYVPTYVAATIIAKNPKKYGFFIEDAQPVVYDTVKISECVDLDIVAQCVDTTFEVIKELNPAVKRWSTPPGVKDFILNLPYGKKELFRKNYENIPADKKRSWVRHKVRSGESLSVIAKKYATTISIIKNHNKIRGTFIRAGQYLLIPVAQNKNYYKKYETYVSAKPKKRPQKITSLRGHKKIVYIVEKGNTLGEIAEKYGTRASKIRQWNGLNYGQHIYPNQKLNIWIPESRSVEPEVNKAEISKNENIYIVRKGDTLWDIAKMHNMSIKELKRLNAKYSNRIKPGEKLKIKSVSGG